MQALEHKIPPPIVMVFMGLVMWLITLIAPSLDITLFVRVADSLIFALAGVAFAIAGVVSFRRAKTTVNPLKPESATALVSSGIYRVTRNPMYVGMLFVLIGWALFLASVWALIGPVVFVLFITRFQILPEERVLANLFGADFRAYQAKVRRWL
jgi:protein-S-isoprenylcysteine O-methyltransferase Ste14